MTRYLLLFLLAPHFLFAQAGMLPDSHKTISSPDGALVMQFFQKEDANGKREMYYSVDFKNKPVILESRLEIVLDNHIFETAMFQDDDRTKSWCEDLVLQDAVVTRVDTVWHNPFGERATVRDHYNQTVLEFTKKSSRHYRMQLVVRAYNEGIAFRYYFPEDQTGVYFHVASEQTAFTFQPETRAYFTFWAQGTHELLPLENWPDLNERPMTLLLPNGLYVTLAEAALVDYARTKFRLDPARPNTVLTAMDGPVDQITPFGTPWRVIMVAERAGDLIAHNDLILNLNPPCAIGNTSWIKPGKMMRDMTLTTDNAKACIDFCSAHNMQYILFDWKWYGPAFTYNSDATTVEVANLDLPGVIKYGQEKGVGVWLYVNQHALLRQKDSLFTIFKKWGVAGVKFGFVQLGSHRWTVWLNEAVKKAAENEMLVNIHDEYRPTGEQRTWPNILTAEGIKGNEQMPDATHNTILPFTRSIAGASDYTLCYYDKRIKTTHAHQLALTVVYFSPFWSLFWYDRPSYYQGEPEIEFLEKIPTVWDDTKVLFGEPGEHIGVARRSGDRWFVGAITNNEGRKETISLDFLPADRSFLANIYTDDPSVQTRTHVAITRRKVHSGDVLEFALAPSGGVAVWLEPE